MTWETFRMPTICRGAGPSGAGCGTVIAPGEPVAVFSGGAHPRCQPCAAAMGFAFDGDLFVSFTGLPQPSLHTPERLANVVTQDELDARRARRATAAARWEARRAARRQGVAR